MTVNAQLDALSQRVYHLETRVTLFFSASTKVREHIKALERGLETLRLVVDGLKSSRGDVETGAQAKAPNPMNTLDIRMPQGRPLDGIISHLAKEFGGNIHEMDIVTITSKTIDDPGHPVKNVADSRGDSHFISEDKPGQWICWDFQDMRVRLTRYAIKAWYLQSWIVEGSTDGANWWMVDRQVDNTRFQKGWNTGSFTVSHAVPCRFIRMTQTGTNGHGDDKLVVVAAEFFGTLSL
jgi:hypothetical protein